VSTEAEKKKTPREVMSALRKERQAQVKAATAMVKEQRQVLRAIREQLKDGPLTVPEIATAAGISTGTVFYYVASMKKYGAILESEKDGSYFRYRLAEPAADSTADTH
jgi:AcrR family transcriptional regulator